MPDAFTRADETLERVRAMSALHQGKLVVSNLHELYALVFSCIAGGVIGTTAFTKILISVQSLFEIRVWNKSTPLLVRIYLFGPEPEGNAQILERHKWILRNPHPNERGEQPLTVRNSGALAAVREAHAGPALEALDSAVQLLQTLATDSLIDIAYSVVLSRAAAGKHNIAPSEVDSPIVVLSLARNLWAYERRFLRRKATAVLLEEGEEEVLPRNLLVPSNMTCLKDGTDNALLCLAAMAVLRSRGYAVGKRYQNLLAVLSAYYLRARVNSSRLRVTARARGVSFLASAPTRSSQDPESRRILTELEQFRQEAEEIERECVPRLAMLLQRLEELGLARPHGATWVPSVSRVRLKDSDRTIDLRVIAQKVDEFVGVLDNLFNRREEPAEDWIRNRAYRHPRTNLLRESQRQNERRGSQEEEWF